MLPCFGRNISAPFVERKEEEENVELRKYLGENRILSKVEGRGGNEVGSVCMLW